MNTGDPCPIPADWWYRAALALIEHEADPDRRAEMRELFEHRAAVAEYCGGLSRNEAERLAFRELRLFAKATA